MYFRKHESFVDIEMTTVHDKEYLAPKSLIQILNITVFILISSIRNKFNTLNRNEILIMLQLISIETEVIRCILYRSLNKFLFRNKVELLPKLLMTKKKI